jgi:hypothetical protein
MPSQTSKSVAGKPPDGERPRNGSGSKFSIVRNHIWLTGPVIIAVVGLIGTGVGATLQGYSNYVLERHKFEYSLIQKALSAPNQTEAAASLRFLVRAGLLEGLNETNISKAADDKKTLPIYLGSAIRDHYLTIQQAKNALSHLKYYDGKVDEVANLKFRIAVMKFQQAQNLEADGFIGPQTVLKLWEACVDCPGLLQGVNAAGTEAPQ